MTTSNGSVRMGEANVEQIPVIWALPERVTRASRLVIWLAPGRSGMEVDAYASFFNDRIDPLTNVRSYAHRPAMTFECGQDDDHVLPDGALRFQRALAGVYGEMQARVRVNLHPGVGHATVPAMMDNCVAWFTEHG